MKVKFIFALAWPILMCSSLVTAGEKDDHDLQAARTEYEHAKSGDEAARVRYVSQLARIADRLVSEYRASGTRNDEEMTTINNELRKHPLPSISDSKKLSQFLVGKWASPRHNYVFRANGKYGMEDGPISSNWRIKGNQLIEDGSAGTIILLNQDYFIYADKGNVFFHSRVKD